MDPKVKEILDENRFQWNVFRTILYFASAKGKNPIPSPWAGNALFCELMDALLEYLGSEEKLGSFNGLYGFDGWQLISNRLLEKSFEISPNKMNPALTKVLLKGLELHFHSDHGEKWHSCSFKIFLDVLPSIAFESTFALFSGWIEETAQKIIPLLDADTLRHCEAIGNLMEKHVKRDVEYIRENYYW